MSTASYFIDSTQFRHPILKPFIEQTINGDYLVIHWSNLTQEIRDALWENCGDEEVCIIEAVDSYYHLVDRLTFSGCIDYMVQGSNRKIYVTNHG